MKQFGSGLAQKANIMLAQFKVKNTVQFGTLISLEESEPPPPPK